MQQNLYTTLKSLSSTENPYYEKPYKCIGGGISITNSLNLYVHYRIYTRYKPFKCSLCGKYLSGPLLSKFIKEPILENNPVNANMFSSFSPCIIWVLIWLWGLIRRGCDPNSHTSGGTISCSPPLLPPFPLPSLLFYIYL